MLKLTLALLLIGYVSNDYGRIGVTCSSDGHISHVLTHSPAFNAGLLVNDRIVGCDGVKGTGLVTGIAGTSAFVTIKRGEEIINMRIYRAPEREVYDEVNN